jgi:hypothetical protein
VPSTAEALELAGKAAGKFWEQFSAVTCTESVTQARLDSSGKTTFQAQSVYDYLVMLQISGTDLLVEESRVPVKQPKGNRAEPLLVTNGFSSLLLIFHPFFQGSYEYAPPEPERLAGREVLRVRFQQARGGRSPTVLQLRRREYPLEWAGSAWLDAASGAVVRIEAGLKAPMEDIGLRVLRAEVSYAPTTFTGGEVHWLPSEARVEAQTLRRHWRNVHRFSSYKQFSVVTKDRVGSEAKP